MATRSRRTEMRADADSEKRIARAAAQQQMSVSAFVLSAAGREADRVLGREGVTLMATEQFDRLVASLDTPEPAAKLREVAAKPRRYSTG